MVVVSHHFFFLRKYFRGRCDSGESHRPLSGTIYFPTATFCTYAYELIILNFPLKVSLWMGTAWTYLRSLVAFVDVTAVPALPA